MPPDIVLVDNLRNGWVASRADAELSQLLKPMHWWDRQRGHILRRTDDRQAIRRRYFCATAMIERIGQARPVYADGELDPRKCVTEHLL